MGFFDRFRRAKPRVAEVRFTDESITHIRHDGKTETLRWDQLEEVGILTTSDGPHADDVFWVLLGPGRTSGCGIASSATGMDALLARLQRLPGFDNEAVVRAMGSATNARFVCWRKATGA